MKRRIYQTPFTEVITTEVGNVLQNISGTGESGKIEWTAPKLNDLLIDDINEDLE